MVCLFLRIRQTLLLLLRDCPLGNLPHNPTNREGEREGGRERERERRSEGVREEEREREREREREGAGRKRGRIGRRGELRRWRDILQ